MKFTGTFRHAILGPVSTVGLVTFIVAVVVLEHPAGVNAVIMNVVICRGSLITTSVNVPAMGDPDPLAPKPVRLTVLSLVQLKVVPGTEFKSEITIFVKAVPEQIV